MNKKTSKGMNPKGATALKDRPGKQERSKSGRGLARKKRKKSNDIAVKKKERTKDESEFKYRSLFKSMLNGFALCKILLDDNGRPTNFVYLEVNDSFERLTGLKKEKIVGKKATEAIPGIKEAHPELFDIYGDVALTGKETSFEIYFKPLNIWLYIFVYCPKKEYFVAVFENITERKRMEKELRDSLDRFDLAVRGANDGLWDWDIANNELYMAPRFKELLGYEDHELESTFENWETRLHPEDHDPTIKAISDHLENKTPYVVEYRLLAKSGEYRWFLARGQALYDNAGKAFRMSGSISDITECKQMEETLSTKEASHRNLIDHNPDSMIIVDKGGIVRFVNPAAQRLFDRKKDKFIGEMFGFPVVKDETTEIEIPRDGKFTVAEMRAVETNWEGKPAYVASIRDVTERKQAEEALRESEERFRQFFEYEPTYCYMISPDGLILDVNKAALAALEYEKDELVGTELNKIYAPESLQKMKDHLEIWKKTGELKDVEIVIMSKTGKRRQVLLSAGVVKDNNGVILHSISIQADVTERKLAEKELIEVNKKVAEEAGISASLLSLSNNISGLLDSKAILNEVSTTILKLTSSEKAAILMKDHAEKDFRAVAFQGWPAHSVTELRSKRFNHVNMPALIEILDGRDVCIDDARTSDMISREIVEALDLKSIILFPIYSGGGVVGAITAERQEPYTKRARDLLNGIASIASTAIENATLYRDSLELAADLARRMDTLASTTEIDRAILSTLDREEILESASTSILRSTPADKVMTIIYDEESMQYSYGSQSIPFGKCPLMDSIIRTGRITSVPDISLYGNKASIVQGLIEEGFGSLLALPLYAKGKRFGCHIMASRKIAAFDREDITTAERLTAQLSVALENSRLYEDIKALFLSTVRALANAVDAKSPWTNGHSERVTDYAIQIGRMMGLSESELERLEIAGLLHDIGKIETYDVVLDKPGKLTDEEFDLVKKHSTKGAEILAPISQLKDILPIVKYHHEKVDGRGYPDGLKGDDIPLLARVLCVADSYDSMTADRPYRKAPGVEFAISELKRCSGTQFDPEVVNNFLKVLDKEDQTVSV